MSAYLFGFILLGIPAVLLVREIGHLIAARWYGVQVLRLSVGLGPEALGFTD
jgi:membrane-associated protease RseP (regulator of RpoE activity)